MKRHKISWLGGVHIQEESSEREFWNFLRVLERNCSKWWHPWYPVQQRVYCGPSRTTGRVVPWWSMLLLPRTWIQFLVRELRFHKPHSQKKTKRTTGWINEFKYILGLMEWSLTLHVSVPASPALTHRPAHSSGPSLPAPLRPCTAPCHRHAHPNHIDSDLSFQWSWLSAPTARHLESSRSQNDELHRTFLDPELTKGANPDCRNSF